MRIIAGMARGRTFDAPQGMDTRPTLDRVRENVFNILQMKVRGARVLDLFSGSGAMAFEAISRGACAAVLVDHDRQANQVQQRNVQKLRMADTCRLMNCDWQAAVRALQSAGEKFDLVLLDPPYAMHDMTGVQIRSNVHTNIAIGKKKIKRKQQKERRARQQHSGPESLN